MSIRASSLKRNLASLSLAGILISSSLSAHGGVIVLFDAYFPSANWIAVEVEDDSGNSQFNFFTQLLSGGNPGAYQKSNWKLVGSGSVPQNAAYVFLDTSQSYVPSVSGAIVKVDWSLDDILISQSGGSAGVAGRAALQQGSGYYRSGAGFHYLNTSWTNSSVTLTASDFELISGSGPANPDFSETGGAINFGYYFGSGGCCDFSQTSETGADNFRVALHTNEVPEPSILSLLGLAMLGSFGLPARRRRNR